MAKKRKEDKFMELGKRMTRRNKRRKSVVGEIGKRGGQVSENIGKRIGKEIKKTAKKINKMMEPKKYKK